MIRVNWDIEEAILLAYLYYQTKDKSTKVKKQKVNELSILLIQRANYLNIEHDEKFRNYAGVKMQCFITYKKINNMENLKEKNNVFAKACKIWREDKERFNLIAKGLILKYSFLGRTENRNDILKFYMNKYSKINLKRVEDGDFTSTKPVGFIFNNDFIKAKSWKGLYVSICQKLDEKNPEKILDLLMKSIGNAKKRIDFCKIDNIRLIKSPQKVRNDIYVETNLGEKDILKKIRELLIEYKINNDDIKILYKINRGDVIKNTGIETDKEEFSKELLDKYSLLLKCKFTNGFRLESTLQNTKIRKEYLIEYCEESKENDNEIENIILKIGVKSGKRVYHPESMLPENERDKLFDYITASFIDCSIIYYEELYNNFVKDLHCQIYKPDMLKDYLEYYNGSKFYTYYFKKSYFVNIIYENQLIDNIKKIIINMGCVMSYYDIKKRLKNIPLNKIKQTITGNEDFIRVRKENYILIDLIDLTDSDINCIKSLILNTLNEDGFMTGNELIDKCKNTYPKIIEKNYLIADSKCAFRDAIKYYIKDEFSFNGNIISPKGKNLTVNEAYIEFCKRKKDFNLTDLYNLRDELDTHIYFDTIYDNSLRIDSKRFVNKSFAYFDVDKTDEVLDMFCVDDYMPINNIKQFNIFPNCNYSWNSFILEHYVYCFSQKYKLIHLSSFSINKTVGVIVKKNSKFITFEDVIIDVLTKVNIDLTKESVLTYLYNNGYIGRKNVKIDSILSKI